MKRHCLAFLTALGCSVASAGENKPSLYLQPYQQANTTEFAEFLKESVEQVGYCDTPITHGGCEGGCSGTCGGSCGSGYLDTSTNCVDTSCNSGGCDDDPGIFGHCPINSGCGSGMGEPWVLFGECGNLKMGGWASLGYHNKALPLFNSRPHDYQLHQAWLYAERTADTSDGFGIGGRIDYVYGTDAQDTQAFGINNDHWDNDWDRGPDYGQALPQVYFEAGYGDLNWKMGHFYTLIGYEVVAAPDNFFYSHAWTMYNSEPFTHTGAIGTYSGFESLDVFGGYVMGWDSAFEDNGDAVLAGASLEMNEHMTLTYTAVGGVFADANNSSGVEQGYMHSVVADIELTDSFRYVFQTDLLNTKNDADVTVRDTIGINQYFIRTLSDHFAIGLRMEWWEVGADSMGFYGNNANLGLLPPGYDPRQEDFDVYALTLGANIMPCPNVTIRPEIRWDWIYGGLNELVAADAMMLGNATNNQATFGIDTIFTF